MLAQEDDQRLVEQPAVVQVDQEAGERAIEARQQLILHAGEVVPVGIPAGARQAELVPEDGDESPAGLDQPPRRQRRLAEERHAVEVARLVRLLAQVERPAQALRADEVVGHGAMAVDARGADADASAARRRCSICSRSERRRSRRSRVRLGPEVGDRAELEPALRRDPAIRLDVLPDLARQRLAGDLRRLADELGADGVIRPAEEPAIRPRRAAPRRPADC